MASGAGCLVAQPMEPGKIVSLVARKHDGAPESFLQTFELHAIQVGHGAVISVFEAGKQPGMTTFGDIGALCWADLNTPDAETASAFYADWLGWKYETGTDGYRHIINGTGEHSMIGGIPAEMHAPAGTPAHWLPYLQVADCKASAATAAKLGASTILPANLMPGVGTIAVLADPQGAVFALYQHLTESR